MEIKRIFILILILSFILNFSSAFIVGKFSVQGPNFCGDGIVGGNEECDKTNLSGQTCLKKGYASGIVKCTGNCTFDESQCVFVPGSLVSGSDGDVITLQSECNDGIDNDGDKLIDFPEDPGCTNYLDNSEKDSSCEINWQAGEWGECIQNIQIRYITDLNHCYFNYLSNESRQCSALVELKKNIFEGIYISKEDLVLIVAVAVALGVAVALIRLYLSKNVLFRKRKLRKKHGSFKHL